MNPSRRYTPSSFCFVHRTVYTGVQQKGKKKYIILLILRSIHCNFYSNELFNLLIIHIYYNTLIKHFIKHFNNQKYCDLPLTHTRVHTSFRIFYVSSCMFTSKIEQGTKDELGPMSEKWVDSALQKE